MSKNIKSLAVFVVLLLLCGPVSTWPQDRMGQKRLIIAYSDKTFIDVDIKDATAAMKSYVNELANKMGIHGESHLYSNIETLISDVQQGKIDLYVLRTMDFLHAEKRLQGEPAIIHSKNGKSASRYLLLVSSDAPISNLSDLRNKKISVLKGDDVAPLFANVLLLREGHPEMKGFFSSIEEKAKPSQAILAVFFGQANACIVEDSAFRTMVELNPQVGRKLRVLKESPDIMTSISFFRKGLPEETKSMVLQKSFTLKTEPRGKQILMLFKIDDITRAKESDIDSLRAMMAEYDRLKGRRASRVAQGG